MSHMVVHSLIDALGDPRKLAYVGFTESIPRFPAPLADDMSIHDQPEQCAFLSHIRLALENARQLWLYQVVPRSFPWTWIRLLHPSPAVREQVIEDARAVWALILRLESSSDASHRRFRKMLFLADIVSFREPMNILQQNGYTPCVQLYEYVESMCSHICSSVSLEARFSILFLCA
jgi:hypothetical protein